MYGRQLPRMQLLAVGITVLLLSAYIVPDIAAACEGGGGTPFSIAAAPKNIKGVGAEATFTVTNLTNEKKTVEKLTGTNPGGEFTWNAKGCEREYNANEPCSWKVKYKGINEDKVTFDVFAEGNLNGFDSVFGKP